MQYNDHSNLDQKSNLNHSKFNRKNFYFQVSFANSKIFQFFLSLTQKIRRDEKVPLSLSHSVTAIFFHIMKLFTGFVCISK